MTNIIIPDESMAAYSLPDMDVLAPIIDKCLRMPEHRHLVENEANINWLMRNDSKVKQGRQILGTAYMPKVNGELSDMFDWMLERLFGVLPDFLITLDTAYWQQASGHMREILVFHELSHCVQATDQYGAPKFNKEGQPVFAIKGHDVEEFTQVVERYGQYSPDLVNFVEAANRAGITG